MLRRIQRNSTALAGVPLLALFLAISLLTQPTTAAEASSESSAKAESEKRLRDDVKKLASDDWEGRGLGTKGIDQAADFLAAEFKRLGYNTELFDGTPFQKFNVTVSNKLGKAERNNLAFEPTEKESASGQPLNMLPLLLGKSFTPLSIGGSGKVDLPIVFVGYGISSKDDKYDDYEGVDVKNKAVIILRHEPQQKNPHSPFDGTSDSMHAPLMKKVSNAYQHGAAAVLFVTDEVEIRGKVAAQRKRWQEALEKAKTEFDSLAKVKNDDLEALDEERLRLMRVIEKLKTQGTDLGTEFDPLLPFERGDASDSRRLPVVHVRRLLIDQLFKASGHPTLAKLEEEIDKDLKPQSFEVKGYRLQGEVQVERVDAEVKNVVAVMEGEGPLADETIVIGAHYDHLGRGDAGSLQVGSKEIHNGADDNASGTAVLLDIARRLAGKKLPRRIVFIAFTGEERGLLGSGHYVHNALYPLSKTVAMLNMDMVGRLKNDDLVVYGTGTAKEFDALVTKLNDRDPFHFTIKREPGGFGPSDHASFYAAKIPVFHFFTGLHNDYHRPSDDIDKLNIEGMRRIGEFVTEFALAIANEPKPPEYQQAGSEKFGRGGTEKKGSRPYFGSIPDLGSTAEGYALQGVAKDGPAEKGGLKAGDIIIGVAENKIGNLDDFDSALRKFKGSDVVEITVKRDGKEQKFKVTLDPPKN
jgi:hypothetical protein